MRKVVVSEFLILDGVMEDPGGSEQFEHGGCELVNTLMQHDLIDEYQGITVRQVAR